MRRKITEKKIRKNATSTKKPKASSKPAKKK